jgi:adenylate kinase
MSNAASRRRPNVLITGTPGTGKTTLASMIVERLNGGSSDNNDDDDDHNDVVVAKHINVGEIVQTHQFYDGHDSELDTHILDEDKLIDYLDPIFDDAQNDSISCITDYHICTVFPERYFDLILVLRTNTEVLYDRYVERKYNDKKRTDNIQSEIMQIILEEAMESYESEIVYEVSSNTIQDMESNIQRVMDWIQLWMKDHNNE